VAIKYLAIVIVSYFLMECVAWIAHKYIMHGFLWRLHKDHHNKESQSFFEKNDYFFLIFAIPGILFLLAGSFVTSLVILLYAGIGIVLYGLTYFLVHDVFIHQRFKVLRNIDNFYFRAIRRAHKNHHKNINKEQGECFGMLWVPLKYFKDALKNR
jgi:beta-carotene 3-hydroxylase